MLLSITVPHKQRNKNPPELVDFRRILGRGDRIRTCEISWSQTKRDTKLRHTPMAFLYGRRCGQTCGQRRFFDGFWIFIDCRKRRRVNGSRRFHFCAGRENIRAPKPSALPTVLHPDCVMGRSPEGWPNALHCNTFPLLRQDSIFRLRQGSGRCIPVAVADYL